MEKVICTDLANVFTKPGKDGEYITTLAFGDNVDVVEDSDKYVKINNITSFKELNDGSIKPSEGLEGYIKKPKGKTGKIFSDKKDCKVLKIDFVDVSQGDGSVIETPEGKVVLIDGGDNQLFARYLANRYKGTTAENPKSIDCIVISHGDSDHLQGLTEIYKSKDYPDPKMDWKKIFIHPERVYHSGLMKRPGKVNNKELKDLEMFGETVKVGDKYIIVDLWEDIRDVPDESLNKIFLDWKKVINEYSKKGKIYYKRISSGEGKEFDFLRNENIDVNVLGPVLKKVDNKIGLEFLGAPGKDSITESDESDGTGGLSASHTINGHSIVLKLKYGNVNFLFSGDINKEAENNLCKNENLKSEVFKVPHHGSADVSETFLNAVNPVISIVSSGDENSRKEYIHPRANLLAMLGKFSRTSVPVIFVTELVAFFESMGYLDPEVHKISDGKFVEVKKKQKKFFAFKRTAFGIVKIRTDGKRLLVYTNSGQDKMKEAYVFEVDQSGNVTPAMVNKI